MSEFLQEELYEFSRTSEDGILLLVGGAAFIGELLHHVGFFADDLDLFLLDGGLGDATLAREVHSALDD